jgi:predicted transcriptional regulator
VDPHDVERIALLSIKPEYAEAIFVGRKTVEFRRSRLAPDIGLVIVYATQPVGRILGWFRVAGVTESTPDGLWRRFRRHGAIRRRDYFSYFDGTDRAYAIEIADPTSINEPLLLNSLSPGLRAPQSFQYLPAPMAAQVVASRAHEDKRWPKLRPALV